MKKGWKIQELGALCVFQRGLTYAKNEEVDHSNNVVLRAMNIDLSTNLLNFGELKYISNNITISENKKIKKGTLLICTASGSKNHLGKIAFVDKDYDYAFGGFMGLLTPREQIIPRFLFYAMTSEKYSDFIAALADGMNINNLKFDDLKKFKVSFPSQQEQQRIIAILDQAFEGIAKAKANAEQNLKNAREVLENHLQTVFCQSNKKENLRLGEAVQEIATGPFGSMLHKSDYQYGGIPLVNPINIIKNTIVPDHKKSLSNNIASKLSRYKLRYGDIVIARRGEIGRCAVVSKAQSGWVCGTGCFIIRPSEHINSIYLASLLRSRTYCSQLERVAGRATMPSISNSDLASLVIWLPPLKEQHRIVRLVQSLQAETQRLESIYQRKIAALDELKKSLLHKAFSGEL